MNEVTLSDQNLTVISTIDKIVPVKSPLSDKAQSVVLSLMSLRPTFTDILGHLESSDANAMLSMSECEQIVHKVKSEKMTEGWAVPYMLALYTNKYRIYSTEHEVWQFISVYLQVIYIIGQRNAKHFKRVNQLCVRVRMALADNSIQMPILESLFDIHATHDKPTAILNAIKEYEAEVRRGEEFGQSKSLNLAQKISQIRIAYEVVIEDRQAITRRQLTPNKNKTSKAPSRLNLSIRNIDIPNRKIRFANKYDKYNYNNVAEAENVADDDPISLLDNNYQPHKIVAKSSQLQQFQLKTNYLHSRRNQFLFPSNTRVLDLYNYQLVFRNLWIKLVSNSAYLERQVISVILLSLLSGRSITALSDEIANNKSTREILIDEGRGDITINNQIDVTSNRIRNIKKYARSHSDNFKIPLPPELNAVLMNKFAVDSDSIDQVLKDIKNELALPALSRQHIESALAFVITHILGERLHSDILTGVSVKHSAPLYYTSIETQSLLNTYQQALIKISGETVNTLSNSEYLYVDNEYLSNYLNPKSSRFWQAHRYSFFINMPIIKSNVNKSYIGSQIALEDRVCQSYFANLATCVEEYNFGQTNGSNSKADTFLEQFNYYSLWFWSIIQIQTGVRPVNDAPGMLNQFNLKVNLYWVSDKAVHQNGYQGRLIPISGFLHTAITNYKIYLEEFASKINALYPGHPLPIQDIKDSEAPLIQIFSHNPKGFLPISPSRISTLLGKFLPQKDNWLRHQLRSLLTNNADELCIRALFGHEDADQEILHPFSSFALNDYKKMAHNLDRVATQLALTQVQVTL